MTKEKQKKNLDIIKEENRQNKEALEKIGYNRKYLPYPIYNDKLTFEGYKRLKYY